MHRNVKLIDLVKSFPRSLFQRVFGWEIWFRYSRERASQSLEVIQFIYLFAALFITTKLTSATAVWKSMWRTFKHANEVASGTFEVRARTDENLQRCLELSVGMPEFFISVDLYFEYHYTGTYRYFPHVNFNEFH